MVCLCNVVQVYHENGTAKEEGVGWDEPKNHGATIVSQPAIKEDPFLFELVTFVIS